MDSIRDVIPAYKTITEMIIAVKYSIRPYPKGCLQSGFLDASAYDCDYAGRCIGYIIYLIKSNCYGSADYSYYGFEFCLSRWTVMSTFSFNIS